MKEIVHELQKKWSRKIIAIIILMAMFFGIFSEKMVHYSKAAVGEYTITCGASGEELSDNGQYTLRRQDDSLRINNIAAGDNIKWSVLSGESVEIVEDINDGVNRQLIHLKAKNIGESSINCAIQTASGENFQVVIIVRVPFAIYEIDKSGSEPSAGDGDGVWMQKLFAEDEHYSIIMNEGASWGMGTDSNVNARPPLLNLIFGNAQLAKWHVTDPNVLQYNETTHILTAIGGGYTRLIGTSIDGTIKETAEIDVYVKPKIQIEGIDSEDVTNKEVSIESGTYISLPGVEFDGVTSELGNDRISWMVTQTIGGKSKFLCDSLGNKAEGLEEVKLNWDDNEEKYLFEGKAGEYRIFFYPKGAYKSFEHRNETAHSGFKAIVSSTYTDKAVYLNVGGMYNLSDALNIPLSVLQNEFDIDYENTTGSAINPPTNYISLGKGDKKGVVTAKALGTAKVKVKRKPSDQSTTIIPGVSIGQEIIITIIVAESFSLTTSKMTMAVGEEKEIYGLVSSGVFQPGSRFEWSTTDAKKQYIDISSDGRYATITAKKNTPADSTVTVALLWTNPDGITQVATCAITVKDSTSPVRIDQSEMVLQSGESKILKTVGLVEGTDLAWVSSDTNIVTVVPSSDNSYATLTGGSKTGIAFITVINKENNSVATCKIIVNQYMTELSIDKGENYTVGLTQGFVQMNAVWTPQNATSTKVKWNSMHPDVATVDENGLVKLLSTGTATIQVESAEQGQPYLHFECNLTVDAVKLTGLAIKEKTLTLLIGQSYTVVPTLIPANPMDAKLNWSSSNGSVARVQDGVITATGVGQTAITVSGGEAKPVSIIVNVRNKLNTIKFEETDITIEEGEKKELRVTYTPAADVNTKLSFVSTDTSIATVDAKGVVTGVKEGMAMIIATAEELGTTGAITCMIHVTAPKVPVEEFSIDPEEMSLFVGEEQQITPIYIPDDTSRQEVTYTTGNEAVATVSEEGLVTAVAPGFTIITCQDVASGKTAICQVSVETGIKFTLSPASREIAIGKSFNLKKVTVPSNAKKTATWKSSNKAIASVNSSGKVTGKKLGSCTITCTLTYYGQSATCRVKVAKLKSSVKLDKTSIRMNIGSTYRLKKTVTSNDSKLPSVKFTSKNSSIASVGANSGKIKAKRVGSTYIVAKTTDATHATARCRVIVIRRASGVSLNKAYAVCYIGRTLKLKAKVSPSNATIKKVKWSSSDKKVAVVNGSGKITGYAEGETYITATTTDGGNKKARCLVKVMEPIETSSIMVAQTNLTMKRGDTAKLSYTILPDDHTDTIKMASDNTRVATVTNSGKVKAVGTGTATITIMAESGVTATVTVNVVALNKTSIRMRQYDTETLVVHGTSDPITWYSANTSIATVVNGRVVGRSVGTTYVYAYVNGCRMSCRIEVVSIN
jgi:Bacterial surface proteins containing Ig-like domains